MAIAFTELTTSESNVDAGSYTTASVTLTAGVLYLVSIGITKAAAAPPTTVATTGAAVSFTQVASTSYNVAFNTTLWRAVPASTTTDTVVITLASATGCLWSIVEVTGTEASGINGVNSIVQSKTAATASAANLTVTLDNDLVAGNARFTCSSADIDDDETVSSGTWTTGTSRHHGSPSTSARAAWNIAPATTAKSAIWDAAGSNGYSNIIVELALYRGASPVGFIPI